MGILLAAVTALSALGPGTVLCIGDDGHVSLEISSQKDCCGTDSKEASGGHTHNEGDSCCESAPVSTHNCFDIPLPEVNIEGTEPCRSGNEAADYQPAKHCNRVDISSRFLSHCTALAISDTEPQESFPDCLIVLRI